MSAVRARADRRGLLVVGAALLATVALLAGCGGSGSSANGKASGHAGGTSSTVVASASTAAQARGPQATATAAASTTTGAMSSTPRPHTSTTRFRPPPELTAPRTTAPPRTPPTVPDVTVTTIGGGALERWHGTWVRTSPSAANGAMSLVLRNSNGMISGFETVSGSACLSINPITGSVHGNAVDLVVSDRGITAHYAGTRSGSLLSGTLTVSCPQAGTGTGTFALTLG